MINGNLLLEVLSFADELDSRDRPLATDWKESACMFLDERELLGGIRLAGRPVAPRFRRLAHTEHHTLDAPAGVAAGEHGCLTRPCFSTPPSPRRSSQLVQS